MIKFFLFLSFICSSINSSFLILSLFIYPSPPWELSFLSLTRLFSFHILSTLPLASTPSLPRSWRGWCHKAFICLSLSLWRLQKSKKDRAMMSLIVRPCQERVWALGAKVNRTESTRWSCPENRSKQIHRYSRHSLAKAIHEKLQDKCLEW